MIQNLFKKETVVESASIILIFRIIERIIQTFRGIIFARWLGPSEYGVFNLAFFFIPLVVSLAKFGIPSCYSRYIPQYEKKNMLGDFLRKNYTLTIGISLLITVFSLLFSKQISVLVYNSAEFRLIIVLCSLSILPYVLYENYFASFQGLRVFKMSSLLRFSQFLIFTVIGIAAVIHYPKAQSAISANLISFIVVSSVFGFIVRKQILNSDSQNVKIQEDNYYSKIFKYSIWFIITPVIGILFNYVDRWMLNRFLGLHDVGIYSVAVNISQMIFVFGMITGNVLMPNLSNMWEHGERDKAMYTLNLAIKTVTLFVLFCAAVLVIFKRPVISLLYGSEYLEGLPVIPILLVFWILNVVVWIIGVYPLLIEKTYLPLISIIPGLVINVALNYTLIPLYGMKGAAGATMISYVLILIALLYLNKREKMMIDVITVCICATPVVLLLNTMWLLVCLTLMSLLVFFSNYIFNEKEKLMLGRQFQNFYQRLKLRK